MSIKCGHPPERWKINWETHSVLCKECARLRTIAYRNKIRRAVVDARAAVRDAARRKQQQEGAG